MNKLINQYRNFFVPLSSIASLTAFVILGYGISQPRLASIAYWLLCFSLTTTRSSHERFRLPVAAEGIMAVASIGALVFVGLNVWLYSNGA